MAGRTRTTALLLASVLLLNGCSTTGKGVAIGALLGAGAGALIDSDKPLRGAAIGAGIGGVAGGAVGYALERQQREFDQRIAGVETQVQQIQVEQGQPAQEQLVVRFSGDVMFDRGSFTLKPGAIPKLRDAADILEQYPNQEILVKGFASEEGTEEYNLQLSERRADAVRKFLITEGIEQYRITSLGFGKAFPIADNSTPEGRALNRRVELQVRERK